MKKEKFINVKNYLKYFIYRHSFENKFNFH